MNFICDINDELFRMFEHEEISVEYSSDGWTELISFLGITLWYSDNDEREECELTGEYEDIEIYIRKEINKLFKKLGNMSILEEKKCQLH